MNTSLSSGEAAHISSKLTTNIELGKGNIILNIKQCPKTISTNDNKMGANFPP